MNTGHVGRRILIIVVLVSGLFVAPVGARGPSLSAYPDEPIIIGVLRPESFLGELGAEMAQGIEMAVSEVEAGGAEIELVYADSACNSGTAAVAMADLIANHGVELVVGALCSSASRGAADVAEANGVLMISPTATQDNIARDGETNREYVFCTAPQTGYMYKAIAAEAFERGYSNPVVIYETDEHEHRADGFDAAWQALGGAGVPKIGWDPGTDDPATVANTVKVLNPDAIGLALDAEDLGTMAEALAAASMSALPLFGGATWEHGAPDCAHLDGAFYITEGTTNGERQVEKPFYAAYEALYGQPPGLIAAYGYDATRYVLQAIENAGSADPDDVREALLAMQFDGVTGKGMFDAYGETNKGVFVLELSDDCSTTHVSTRGATTGLTIDGPQIVARGEPVSYTSHFWSGQPNGYLWDTGDSVLSGHTVTHTYEITGSYTVSVTAYSRFETTTESMSITVLDMDEIVHLPLIMR